MLEGNSPHVQEALEVGRSLNIVTYQRVIGVLDGRAYQAVYRGA